MCFIFLILQIFLISQRKLIYKRVAIEIATLLFSLSPPYNPLHQWSNREDSHICNRLGSLYIGRNRIRHNELIQRTSETNMRTIRKYTMRSKCTNRSSSSTPQYISCLDNRPTRLDQIIDDNHSFSLWIPFFDRHDSPISVSDLITDNPRYPWEYILESLGSAIIRKHDHLIWMESQESSSRMELGIDTIRIEE